MREDGLTMGHAVRQTKGAVPSVRLCSIPRPTAGRPLDLVPESWNWITRKFRHVQVLSCAKSSMRTPSAESR